MSNIIKKIRYFISRSKYYYKLSNLDCFSAILRLIKLLYYILNKPASYKLANKLSKLYLDGNLDGSFNSFSYGDLEGIWLRHPKLFRNIITHIQTKNIDQINNMLCSSNQCYKIKVGFLVFSAAMWNCDGLYHLFERDNIFEPIIYVRSEYANKPIIESELYDSTLKYFKENYTNVIGLKTWSEYKSPYPDLLFHQQPYSNKSPLNILSVPLSTLNLYIPYSIGIDKNQNKVYHSFGYKYSWKVFCSTQFDLDDYKNISPNDSANGVYLGYPKIDAFIQDVNSCSGNKNKLWKIPPDCDEMIIKIIYAPHHSIGPETIQFSTFKQNHTMLYEYAKNHSKTTSWIIKPHPALKYRSIIDGVFKTEEEYEEYLDKWNQLPNAKVAEDGVYDTLFKTSDGMILDSVSFITEYQYTGKPLLFLTRPEQKFTSSGKNLINILYTANGSDFHKIEIFIEKVLLNKQDVMKEKRRLFFERYLEYFHKNNEITASEAIYKHIKSYFTDNQSENHK